MTNELISVIVPVYNVAEYLRECLDSIISQTYTNLEIILVDDGSTDNSGKICDEYEKIDERIKVIHKENGGLSDARNAGLDICRGDYIGFVDSDDCISPNMYYTLYCDIKKYNADISVCGAVARKEDLEKNYCTNDNIKYLEDKNKIIEAIFCPTPPVPTISACIKLYKKVIFSEVRFAVGKIPEDAMIIMDIIDNVSSIVFSRYNLYYYRNRENSITHKRKWSKVIYGFIDAYTSNYNVIKEKYPSMIDAGENRLWWAYRNAIYIAASSIDAKEHTREIFSYRRKLFNDLIRMPFNKYQNMRKIIATIIAIISPRLYVIIKDN